MKLTKKGLPEKEEGNNCNRMGNQLNDQRRSNCILQFTKLSAKNDNQTSFSLGEE